MKRFYREAGVSAGPERFAVLLDGKQILTPGKQPLELPTRSLAEAIAAEWEAQREAIVPHSMPLMRLASTAIDRVSRAREGVIEATAKYAATDLLCYRAAEPPDLIRRQSQAWQPLLDWASRALDAPLQVATGVLPLEQPEESIRAVRLALVALDDFRLTAVADLTATAGSVVLALAALAGTIDADAACEAALLDESFQIERWGEDREAANRLRSIREEIRAAFRFLELLGNG